MNTGLQPLYQPIDLLVVTPGISTIRPLNQPITPANPNLADNKNGKRPEAFFMPSWLLMGGYRLGNADQANNVPELGLSKKFRLSNRLSFDVSAAVAILPEGGEQSYSSSSANDTIMGTSVFLATNSVSYFQAKKGYGISPQIRLGYALSNSMEAFVNTGLNLSRQNILYKGTYTSQGFYGEDIVRAVPFEINNNPQFVPTTKINGRTTAFAGAGLRMYVFKHFALSANYNRNFYVAENPLYKSKKMSRDYLLLTAGITF